MQKSRIAIIGSGATAVYTLKHLLESEMSLDITIFEANSEVGKGMPYSSGMNADYMLCNAFSKEIPPVTRSLLNWLNELPKRDLGEWELSPHDISARAFYPRVLIGEFLADEFKVLCSRAERLSHHFEVRSAERVVDIICSDEGSTTIRTASGRSGQFDHVIIATGHSWTSKPKLENADLLSPWPYTNVTKLEAGNIGILGSSLSAIDVAVALGTTHGKFVEDIETINWQPNVQAINLKITMVSKDGIIPEGDFYYPYPYEPLKIFSSELVDAEIQKGSVNLLERLFAILIEEIGESDPVYLQTLGAEARSLDGFSEAYFLRRKELGGLRAVRTDFATARLSLRERKTIPYRYVLLRAHENFDRALRVLDANQYSHFTKTLLPVFADSYAAVPHLSLARIMAMFDAGVLQLKASGDNANFENSDNGGVEVTIENEELKFDVLIDARGQSTSSLHDLPFPSLVNHLAHSEEPIDSPFKLQFSPGIQSSIYCLALPQLLQRYPFSQGLINSAENGKIVIDDIMTTINDGGDRVASVTDRAA